MKVIWTDMKKFLRNQRKIIVGGAPTKKSHLVTLTKNLVKDLMKMVLLLLIELVTNSIENKCFLKERVDRVLQMCQRVQWRRFQMTHGQLWNMQNVCKKQKI